MISYTVITVHDTANFTPCLFILVEKKESKA